MKNALQQKERHESMHELTRITSSLENALLDAFDQRNAAKGYATRSEAIRDLIRERLIREEAERAEGEQVAGPEISFKPRKNSWEPASDSLRSWLSEISRGFSRLRAQIAGRCAGCSSLPHFTPWDAAAHACRVSFSPTRRLRICAAGRAETPSQNRAGMKIHWGWNLTRLLVAGRPGSTRQLASAILRDILFRSLRLRPSRGATRHSPRGAGGPFTTSTFHPCLQSTSDQPKRVQ
jgi:hypothetical protein